MQTQRAETGLFAHEGAGPAPVGEKYLVPAGRDC
jgi:hypothetical protein